jgi:hypothetical protein
MRLRTGLRSGGTALAMTVGLLAAGGTADAGTSTSHQVKVEVCANGNYTAYAKWAELPPGSSTPLSVGLPHVSAGNCGTSWVATNNDNNAAFVWLFGLYNTSGTGFDVNSNGSYATSFGSAGELNTIVLHALGTTTTHAYYWEAWGAFGYRHGTNF